MSEPAIDIDKQNAATILAFTNQWASNLRGWLRLPPDSFRSAHEAFTPSPSGDVLLFASGYSTELFPTPTLITFAGPVICGITNAGSILRRKRVPDYVLITDGQPILYDYYCEIPWHTYPTKFIMHQYVDPRIGTLRARQPISRRTFLYEQFLPEDGAFETDHMRSAYAGQNHLVSALLSEYHLPRMATAGSAAGAAYLAVSMNSEALSLRRIFLAGTDFSYNPGSPSHCFRYRLDGSLWSSPTVPPFNPNRTETYTTQAPLIELPDNRFTDPTQLNYLRSLILIQSVFGIPTYLVPTTEPYSIASDYFPTASVNSLYVEEDREQVKERAAESLALFDSRFIETDGYTHEQGEHNATAEEDSD